MVLGVAAVAVVVGVVDVIAAAGALNKGGSAPFQDTLMCKGYITIEHILLRTAQHLKSSKYCNGPP